MKSYKININYNLYLLLIIFKKFNLYKAKYL